MSVKNVTDTTAKNNWEEFGPNISQTDSAAGILSCFWHLFWSKQYNLAKAILSVIKC